MIERIMRLRLFHYIVAGGASFAVEYSTFLILYYGLHISGIQANTYSFIFGLCTSFTINRLWVFKRSGRQYHGATTQVFMYSGLALTNLLITSVAIGYLINLGTAAYIAKVILITCVASWNFIIFRYVIFIGAKSLSDQDDTKAD